MIFLNENYKIYSINQIYDENIMLNIKELDSLCTKENGFFYVKLSCRDQDNFGDINFKIDTGAYTTIIPNSFPLSDWNKIGEEDASSLAGIVRVSNHYLIIYSETLSPSGYQVSKILDKKYERILLGMNFLNTRKWGSNDEYNFFIEDYPNYNYKKQFSETTGNLERLNNKKYRDMLNFVLKTVDKYNNKKLIIIKKLDKIKI